VVVSRDVIVDETAKGSQPRSEFEINQVEAPGEKPGLNGEPVRTSRFGRVKPLGRKVQMRRRTRRTMGKLKRTPPGETKEIGGTR
jgi:hypothetical protein